MTSASIIVPSASIPAARQNRSKLARTSANASSTAPVAGEPAGVISLVMALLSFVESAPRAYRLKVGNADIFRNSTEPGTSPEQAATYVVRIFNGVPPGELPFQGPTRFDFTINMKTAKALGVTIPPSLLVSAEVID
ncbi:ABC transporter substrate binding protein (plasmid) [Bradyrhizobium sp. CB82]|uniref:ABC transporter substrate binding protein n=1 Tax=Bradyrhizobium sp. CB82 TaxID=3039159 RepID=UPI0024B158F9|nr:ABC transporter substrate binding protein [Bradyrhizobium sp. CB82]WFU45989.1 ABC transporter substrate binding protein [Bradyrhizobium sp. CB82]